MHRCFTTPELVDGIISHLDPTYRPTSRSLAVLARTARLFQEPALDALWRNQSSVWNLLYCLPPDVVERVSLKNTDVNFLRPVLASDCERLVLYARRVKTFSSSSGEYISPLSHPEIFLALSFIFPAPGSLFPNLIDLTWNHDEKNFSFVTLLLGPKITKIELRLETPQQASLLPYLPGKCPSLVDLKLSFTRRAESWTSIRGHNILEFAQELRCITHLRLGANSIDSVSLKQIGQISSLQSFHMTGWVPPEALVTLEPPLFVSLRSLHMVASRKNIPSTARFLELCSDAFLDSFSVEFTDYIPAGLIQPLLAALADSQCSSLTTLSIRQMCFVTLENQEDVFTIDWLRPALRFSNLTHINIWLLPGFDLDDEAVSEMAQAWPRLRSLCLKERVTEPRTTLRSMQLLARHCPGLRDYNIGFTTDEVPSIEEPPFQNMRLRSLGMKPSPLHASQVVVVARFLSAIFPNLRDVNAARAPYGYHQQWREVERLLPIFVQVRQEGKRWA
ncbi:hypothetical protein FB45DRAFT_823040 [Roridomyces roridus]|uniref:F-box domain-containing protein n=1 Tax=Roridomyces roridus TaxID=1738132 RepID=A0AAD7FZQ5_9AGAR|nr:hypothetical protein FB45DRAFT_823040 [Roridomyces roridus]